MSRSPSRSKFSYTPTRGAFAGHRFRSKREYRKALAKMQRPVMIRTLKDLGGLSATQQARRADALEVLGLMRREDLSLSKAVHKYRLETPDSRITPRSVTKYVRTALYKKKGKPRGPWIPKKSDRLLRLVQFPVRGETQLIETRDSRIASQIGRYWNAVKHYLNTGETSALKEFRGKEIRVGKNVYKFVTGPKALERLAEFGFTDLDSIYERSGISR
jgi:hypothetical protein